MPDRRVSILVDVEEDLQGLKAAEQGIERFSQLSIRNMDKLVAETAKLQQGYAKLQSELAQTQKAQIELDKSVKNGSITIAEHIRMKEALTRREAELKRAAQATSREYSAYSQQLGATNRLVADSQQKLSLLASQFGVVLPGSMGRFLVQMGGVQRALNLAFGVTLIGGFAAGLTYTVLPALERVREKVFGIGEELRNVVSAISGLNVNILAGTTAQDAGLRARDIRREIAGLEAQRSELRRRALVKLGLLGAAGPFSALPTIITGGRELLAGGLAGIKAGGADVLAIDERLAALRSQLLELETAVVTRHFAETAKQREAAAKAAAGAGAGGGGAAGSVFQPAGFSVLGRYNPLLPLELQVQLARGHAGAIESVLGAQAAQAAARGEQFLAGQQGLLANDQFAQEFYTNQLTAEQYFQSERVRLAQEAAEQRRALIQSEAAAMESFYDRVVGSARSAGDVLKNLWRELAANWKRSFFEMLAASRFGGGGIAAPGFGLGSLFGLGAPLLTGLGPGGTAPFIDAGAAGGAGAISGAAAAVTTPTTASLVGLPATTPAGTALSLAGLGSALRSPGALALGGLAGLSLIGSGSRLASGLGGFFGGGLTGLALGGSSLLGGTAIGAFAGPIGALAGLTLGLIFGGGGKAKQHDTAIENAGFAQIKQLVEEYERHRLDYAQTYEGIQSVYQQMVGQFQRSASRQNASYWYQQYLAHIQRIEDERNRRRGLSLPVPEFASGGLVGGAAAGGGVLAMLHPGEFVMSSEAVRRFGADLLERMNSGAAGGDGYVMQVWTPSKEFAAQVVEMGTPVVIGRGGAAKRLLRG